MVSGLQGQARREATLWAQSLFARSRFLIMDTETTGLGGDDELCSIGIIDGSGNMLLDSLIRPSKSIPWYVTKIHGITNKAVQNAPTFPELYPQIVDLLSREPLVVYNLSFDRRMLENCQRLYGLPRLRYYEPHCAMLRYAQFYGDWNYGRRGYRWHKLSVACGHWGIELIDTHSAIGDAHLTLQLLQRMAGIVQ